MDNNENSPEYQQHVADKAECERQIAESEAKCKSLEAKIERMETCYKELHAAKEYFETYTNTPDKNTKKDDYSWHGSNYDEFGWRSTDIVEINNTFLNDSLDDAQDSANDFRNELQKKLNKEKHKLSGLRNLLSDLKTWFQNWRN